MFCFKCGYNSGFSKTQCINCNAKINLPRTQKGIGLHLLPSIVGSGTVIKVYSYLQKPEDVTDLLSSMLPAFARPAPSKPRHGYIDSKIVKTVDEIRHLLGKVLADDPEGELILCSYIDSGYNAVITPGSITVGKGNSGATEGKHVVEVPLTGNCFFSSSLLESAKISPKEWPYIEVVYNKSDDSPYLTQLRGGPELPSVAGNYVPFATPVKRVLEADPKKFKDRGWEKEMEDSAGEEGLVVWHPGGSMTSHFAIHAFTNGLPIVFDQEAPEIGSILEPTTTKENYDADLMLKGFVVGSKLSLSKDNVANWITVSLVILHNATVMTNQHSKWLGLSAAILLRAGTAALNGEARHFSGNPKQSREIVYGMSFNKSMLYHRTRIMRLVNIFRYGVWQSAGFGGLKWACCGATTVDLLNAVHKLALQKDQSSALGLVKALNLMVNQAHNGGWWFNKFVNNNLFEEVSKNNIKHLYNHGALFYKTGNAIDKASCILIGSEITKIQKWGIVQLSPPRALSASIYIHPSIGSIEVKIQTKLLKNKNKAIRAAIPSLATTDVKSLKNNIYLVEGDDGYRIEMNKENPTVIWADESLRALSMKAL